MQVNFERIQYLPLICGLGYLFLTVALFFEGVFDWPVDNGSVLLVFLIVSFFAIGLGFFIGVVKKGSGRELSSWRTFYRVGAIASIVLVFPATWVYTGKWPWEIFSVLKNQGLAYEDMLVALEADESGIRGYLAIVKAIFAPFVFCVIPFAILKWKELQKLDVLLLITHIGAILVFSLMRGTDRETGDLLVYVMMASIVVVARLAVKYGRFPFKISRVVAILFLLSAVFIFTLTLFIERKESRMGGAESFCIAKGVVCSERDARETELFKGSAFAFEMLTAYVSQGYYGLSLALKEDFTSTYGLGHSSFIMSAYTKYFDDSIYKRSYLYKVSQAGWNDKAQWSSMFPWIANDVGFPSIPVLMVVFGFFWGSSWKSAVVYNSDVGTLVFLFLSLAVFYMPANNQLTQALDSYYAFLFWFFIWLFTSKNKGIEN
jgi:hypothetical protein